MFLRSTNRTKDGKDHRYFSIVENRRLPGGKTAQRIVLYLGEINDHQQAAWRKTLDVFVEAEQRYTTMSLFPEDREIPADALDSAQIRLSGLELRRPRVFGSCWLACELWQQLGLDEFWQERLPEGREAVSWEKVLRLLVVNRLLDPGSEFRVHPMVCRFRHGPVIGDGLRGGGERPAVSLPGPRAGAQAGVIRLAEAEVGGLIQSRF